ncbi:Hypothetical predicted protein [Pelobates cultripes]|uniref:Uncharacterized protein n=1 Tax=Pelobates cultripes TaxID=61616 RepID=A0AAD1RG61_PELCU|nr:Hypothetical predicted protein [Pelobates cultripes]
MQHTINTFILEGKKARVAAGTLQQTVRRGGLGLPNLTAYCRAAYLHNISQINLPAKAPQWVAIESHWAPRRDLRALIWQEKCPRHTRDKLLPSTQTLLQIWHKIRDKLVAKQTLPMATPLQTIGLDIPTFPWETWAKGGIHHIYQVIDRGRLKPLPAIQEEYTLPSKVIFSYMQLKSYVSSKLGAEDELEDGINMTKCEKHSVGIKKLGKTLSWGYQELITTQTQTLDKIKQVWHQELGQTFPDDTWDRAYLAHQGLTACYTHLELQRKLLYRWDIPKHIRTILYHTIISANLMISRLWKKTMPPTLQDVIKQVEQNWEYELMAVAQFGTRTHIYEAHKTWKASTKPEVRGLEAIDALEGRTQTTHQGPQ